MAPSIASALFEHRLVPSTHSRTTYVEPLPLSSPPGIISPWVVKSWLYYELPPESIVTDDLTILDPFFTVIFDRRLAPAVKLADNFFHRSMDFWMRVYFAPVRKTDNQSRERLSSSWRATSEEIEMFKSVLQDLQSAEYRICFLPPNAAASVTHLSETALVNDQSHCGSTPKIFTGISADLLDLIMGDSWPSIAHQSRRAVYTALALTLIEQFAHVVWMKRWIDYYKKAQILASASHRRLEPHFKIPAEPSTSWGPKHSNLGVDVSYYLFGLEIQLPYRDTTVIHGSSTITRPIIDGSGGLQAGIRDYNTGRTTVRYILGAETIRSFFDGRSYIYSFNDRSPRALTLFLVPHSKDASVGAAQQSVDDDTLPSSDDEIGIPECLRIGLSNVKLAANTSHQRRQPLDPTLRSRRRELIIPEDKNPNQKGENSEPVIIGSATDNTRRERDRPIEKRRIIIIEHSRAQSRQQEQAAPVRYKSRFTEDIANAYTHTLDSRPQNRGKQPGKSRIWGSKASK